MHYHQWSEYREPTRLKQLATQYRKCMKCAKRQARIIYIGHIGDITSPYSRWITLKDQ